MGDSPLLPDDLVGNMPAKNALMVLQMTSELNKFFAGFSFLSFFFAATDYSPPGSSQTVDEGRIRDSLTRQLLSFCFFLVATHMANLGIFYVNLYFPDDTTPLGTGRQRNVASFFACFSGLLLYIGMGFMFAAMYPLLVQDFGAEGNMDIGDAVFAVAVGLTGFSFIAPMVWFLYLLTRHQRGVATPRSVESQPGVAQPVFPATTNDIEFSPVQFTMPGTQTTRFRTTTITRTHFPATVHPTAVFPTVGAQRHVIEEWAG